MDFTFDPTLIQTVIIAVIGIIFSTGISWAEEQAGWFQNLSPEWKVKVNAIATLIVPAIAQWLSPYWRPEFGGDATTFAYNVLLLLLPVGTYIWSQIAHAKNPLREGAEIELEAGEVGIQITPADNDDPTRFRAG
jgi:hypothetical protein